MACLEWANESDADEQELRLHLSNNFAHCHKKKQLGSQLQDHDLSWPCHLLVKMYNNML